jgi:hypothetical protein
MGAEDYVTVPNTYKKCKLLVVLVNAHTLLFK